VTFSLLALLLLQSACAPSVQAREHDDRDLPPGLFLRLGKIRELGGLAVYSAGALPPWPGPESDRGPLPPSPPDGPRGCSTTGVPGSPVSVQAHAAVIPAVPSGLLTPYGLDAIRPLDLLS
jgi:hypothetical protein